MPKIIIPCSLRRYTNNVSIFETKAKNVEGAIQDLTQTFQELQQYLFEPCGKFRSFIRVFIGSTEVNELKKTERVLQQETVISIIPAIAGG